MPGIKVEHGANIRQNLRKHYIQGKQRPIAFYLGIKIRMHAKYKKDGLLPYILSGSKMLK